MRGKIQKWMKQSGTLLLAAVLVATTPCSISAEAAKTKVKSAEFAENTMETTNQMHFDYSFGAPKFEVGTNGYQVLLEDSMAINQEGMPDLPAKTVSVLLPAGKTVANVNVKKANVQVFENMLIAPAAGFEKLTEAELTAGTTEAEEEEAETTVSDNTISDAQPQQEEETAQEEASEEDALTGVETETPQEGAETATEEESLDEAEKKAEAEAKTLIETIDFTDSEIFNQSVYSGESVYPAADSSQGEVQTIRGFKVFNITLYPMSYTGTTLSYCDTMSLDITLADEESEDEYIPTEDDLTFLSDDVDAASYANTYFSTTAKPKTGTTIAGKGQIDYIIITNKALSKTFQKLADYKASKGLRTAVVTTEKIYKNYKGYDKAERVRKFIQDAYKKNRVKYVLLGGDGDEKANSKKAVVPTRMLYCDAVASGEKPTFIASDVYYSCLDGTFDNNKNHKYGEKKDGVNGGDIDKQADVYVGRAPVDNKTEAENFIKKVINYETRPKSAKALMIGEQLSGNINCSVELAANLQHETAPDTLTDTIRKLRDEKIKEEYIELYYDSNAFVKEVYLSNLSLLGKTVTLLVDYEPFMAEYLSTGTSTKTMTMEELLSLQNYCEEFANAVASSETPYAQKDRLVAEVQELSAYLGTCEGVTFGEMLENSKFCRSESETVDTASFEKLDNIFGGTYKEEIRLGSNAHNLTTRKIPDNYTVSTLYDKDSANQEWTKDQLLTALNSSPELINHLGHANVDSLMRLNVKEIRELSNANAFFFYSQGCYAGSFDNRKTDDKYSKDDSIAEELLVSSATSGAFACVVNSRYGWYNSDPSSTKGPSQLYDRVFWDEAMYGSDKSLGAILAKSRQNKNILDNFNDDSYGAVIRYCFYEITLLGDPETKLHDLNDPLLTQTTLKVKKSGGKASLSWKAVSGADKYVVYRSTSKNGTYTKVTTTKKTSYKDNKKGKYFYKVAAVKKVGNKTYYRYSAPKKG